MNKRLSANSRLYISKGFTLFIGSIIDTDFHKHHSIQITIALDNNFYFQNENEIIPVKSIIINSNNKHKIIGKDGNQLLLLIEPESIYGENIRNYLKNAGYCFFTMNKDLNKKLNSNINSKNFNILSIVKIIFSCLNINMNRQTNIDDRIIKAIKIIENTYEKKITVKELARRVFLSESRLQHIFKNQIGISIKRYLLWKRLIDGINIIINAKNFTYASHEAGFSDSAHMSRTFKEMLGINLLDIFKDSRSIQVKICNY